MYLTYEEYQSMGGTLDEATFNYYEYSAEATVDWYTFDRLHNETEYPEKVRKLMFHLIQLIQTKTEAMTGVRTDKDGNLISSAVTKQTNDGVSIEFNVLSSSSAITLAGTEIKDCVGRYLSGVKNSLGRLLLYRGIYPGE